MNERRMQFLVGVLVFATMVIAGLLATVNEPMPLGWFPWGKSRYQIGIQLREAPGVAVNTPIRKNGILIGRVKSIEDHGDGIVVWANIDGDRPLYPEYQPHVRASVLNDATIDFVTQPLRPGSQPVPDGTVFRGVVDPNPFESLARLGDLQQDFAAASRSLAKAGEEVADLAQRINKAFGDETQEGRVSRLLDSTERAITQFGQTMQAINEIIGDEPATTSISPNTPRQPNGSGSTAPPSNLQSPDGTRLLATPSVKNQQLPAGLQPLGGQSSPDQPQAPQPLAQGQQPIPGPELRRRIREGLNELPDAIRDSRAVMRDFRDVLESAERNFHNLESFTEPLGQRGEEIADSIIKAVDGIDRLLEDLNMLVQAVNNREGTIGRLIHDPQTYENLNTLMLNANRVLGQVYELSLRMRPVVEDARVFMDKIAREPGRVVTGGLNPSIVK